MTAKNVSIHIPWEADKVLQNMCLLSSPECPVYVVGGAIRDLLLGRAVYDLDLITVEAEEISRKLGSSVTGTLVKLCERSGQKSFRFVFPLDKSGESSSEVGKSLQVNPENACGRKQHYWIDIGCMSGAEITHDLERRDFTVNAMALSLSSFLEFAETGSEKVIINNIIDPFGGLNDLIDKKIRAVSESVFKDDPLRLWRIWRLAAVTGLSPDDTLTELAAQNNHLCWSVAGERIRSELLAMLSNNTGAAWLAEAARHGLVDKQFPVMRKLKECDQGDYHHQDVWKHSLQVLKELENITNNIDFIIATHKTQELFHDWLNTGTNLPVLKLAGLFHDIGKPQVREIDGDGRIRFFNHERAALPDVEKIAGELCLSRRETELLLFLVRGHLQIINIIEKASKKTQVKFWRNNGEDTLGLILLGCADMISKQGPRTKRETVKDFIYNEVPSFAELWLLEVKPSLEKEELLTGKELMDYFNLEPGRQIGRLKEAIREAQLDGLIKTHEEAISLAGEMIREHN